MGSIEATLKTSRLCDNLCVFVDQNELSCVAVAVVNPVKLHELAKGMDDTNSRIIKSPYIVFDPQYLSEWNFLHYI